MTLKAAKQAAEVVVPVPAVFVPAPVALRRVYVDISGTVDTALELAARAASMPKKRYLEKLINDDAIRTMDEASGQKRVKK